MNKRRFLSLIGLLMCSPLCARVFQPTLSVLGTYTATSNHFEVASGLFNWKSRKLNFGLEATNKFRLGKVMFLKTGLRYNQYQTTINGLNQISVLMDNPYPFTWERRFESLSVPVLFGKDFLVGNRDMDIYLGASFGILMTSYSMTGSTIALKKEPDNTDMIIMETADTGRLTPAYFFPTIDFGGSYHPFKKTPAFSVGLQCSVQLNATDTYRLQAIAANYTRNETYVYQIANHQSFVNCSLLISYTLGRTQNSKRKTASVKCPS